MTPLSEREVRALVADVATLMAKTSGFEKFQADTGRKDEAQDRALLAVETRCTLLERSWQQYVADREDDKKKAEKRHKAVFALLIAIASDNLGYNLWEHAQPYLAPYMSKSFFWFSVTVVMFLLFTYGIWVGLNSFKGRKEKS